jgi:DNA-binding MarR family transcriptional regulator
MTIASPQALEPAGVAPDASEIRRGVMHLSRRLRVARGSGALSSSKLSLLSHLARRGAMTPGQLAAAESLRPQSLTRLLAELEDEQLLSRTPHPEDGRQSLVAVTDAGRAALAHDVAGRDAWLSEALLRLTPAERDILAVAGRLMEFLADLPDMLDAANEAAKPEPAPPVGGGT